MRLFTGYSISDGNPSFSKSGVFLTVEGWGLIPSRDKDRMGIGGYYNELSSDLKDLTSTLHPLDDTWGFELYYNAEVTPWLHISADAQFASNATEEDSTATILGLRAVIEL
jgi:porin